MVVNNTSVILQTFLYVVNQSYIANEDTSAYSYFQDIGKETNATRCYGMYGCFNLSAPWTSVHRPVALFPEDLSKIQPRYPVYTRTTRFKPGIIDINEFNFAENAGIDPHKPIYLISHGYMEGGEIYWIKDIAYALLDMQDCSVIVVDWHVGSSPPYTQAVANIRLVGAITAHLLGEIASNHGLTNLDHVHCIGHSLGAHLSGYIGYTLQKEYNLTLGRITGMDPAEPHFAKAQPPVRLDRQAAKYVDIIHTDASQFIRGGLGITESIGHVDYYPNGGNNQPGCGKSIAQYIHDEKGSFFRGVRKYLGCNHVRSHEFFYESINPKCSFLTIACASFEDLTKGKCFGCGKKGERCLKFGFHGKKDYDRLPASLKSKNLVQYLMTGDSQPYCRAHYRITVQISDAEESKNHGGEIGQLIFTMHSSSDGKGVKTSPIPFISGYHEPGSWLTSVVAAQELPQLKAVEVQWKYNSSLFNPLTWRILTIPKIYLSKVTVEALEINSRLTVCAKHQKPFVNAQPQLLIPSYC